MNILKSRNLILKSKQLCHTKLVINITHRFKNIFCRHLHKIIPMVEQCQKLPKSVGGEF